MNMNMNMINKEWQNRQEKHIPPKSQSSFESLKTNNESVAEKKSRNNRNNKEALNLHFRITGWMKMKRIKVNVVVTYFGSSDFGLLKMKN